MWTLQSSLPLAGPSPGLVQLSSVSWEKKQLQLLSWGATGMRQKRQRLLCFHFAGVWPQSAVGDEPSFPVNRGWLWGMGRGILWTLVPLIRGESTQAAQASCPPPVCWTRQPLLRPCCDKEREAGASALPSVPGHGLFFPVRKVSWGSSFGHGGRGMGGGHCHPACGGDTPACQAETHSSASSHSAACCADANHMEKQQKERAAVSNTWG